MEFARSGTALPSFLNYFQIAQKPVALFIDPCYTVVIRIDEIKLVHTR
jgi:hypothetical protein